MFLWRAREYAVLQGEAEREAAEQQALTPAVSYAKGEELGRFNMGSTVILFFQKGRVNLDLELDQVLRMGEKIGTKASLP